MPNVGDLQYLLICIILDQIDEYFTNLAALCKDPNFDF